MHTVILVTRQETEEIKALLEASLGSQAEIEVFPSLSDLFPDVMKLDPVLALVDGHSVQENEIGIIHVLKSTYSNLRIIFTFRLDERDKAAQALKNGVDAYILEPYYISEFSLFLQREFKSALFRSRHSLDLKMDALATFVEGFAPEINNPLTTVRGFLQILKTGNGIDMDSDELAEIYTLMEKESLRISELVTELENFACTRKPKRLPIDIHALIEQAAEEAKEAVGKNVPVAITIEKCPPEV